LFNFVDFVNFVNYTIYMNKKLNNINKINNNANTAQIITQEDRNEYARKSIYMRDDQCDWGSSGLNDIAREDSNKN